jgi:hypothetical protein
VELVGFDAFARAITNTALTRTPDLLQVDLWSVVVVDLFQRAKDLFRLWDMVKNTNDKTSEIIYSQPLLLHQ